MRPVIFRSTKFCQGLPNFKDAVVLPRSRTNFCQAWNLSDLSIYTPWFEGISRKFDLYFWSEYFSPKPAKIKFIFTRQPNDKHGWFVPRYAPGGSIRAIRSLVLISMWLTLLVNKYFAVIQTNFVEIFGRAKQILSVQCVRTHSEYRESWMPFLRRPFVTFLWNGDWFLIYFLFFTYFIYLYLLQIIAVILLLIFSQ